MKQKIPIAYILVPLAILVIIGISVAFTLMHPQLNPDMSGSPVNRTITVEHKINTDPAVIVSTDNVSYFTSGTVYGKVSVGGNYTISVYPLKNAEGYWVMDAYAQVNKS